MSEPHSPDSGTVTMAVVRVSTTCRHVSSSMVQRFLPEGLQQVYYNDHPILGGVHIQLGQEARQGNLWFFNPNTDDMTIVPMTGRPAWFRATTQPNQYLVGMENTVGLVAVQDATGTFVVKHTLPAKVTSPRIMINDGCVAPNNDIICGCKDFDFDIAARLAGTFCYHEGNVTELEASGETCGNGNAFISIDGVSHLLHIDTPTKLVRAYPYDFATGAVGAARSLIDFGNQAWFEAACPGVWHEMLLPDGVCHWTTADRRDKLVVAVFDARSDALRNGQALQFDVTNGEVKLEVVYEIPGSPKVTHPAVFATPGQRPQLWFTTADEGLIETLAAANIQADTTNVGGLFMCEADPGLTGLHVDGGWTSGVIPYKV
eukprot:m.81697 g.81697  ORF g.81697 m.81697 type:complete len:374 (-) comp14577_c0_seq18:615-1736(-)